MDWSNETSLEFLHLYESENIIWDYRHPGHKNRLEVHKAWKRIHESLSVQCTFHEMKKKKDSLMAMFRSLYTKVKQCALSGEVYRPNWFAYDTMERFLKAVYQPRIMMNSEGLDDDTENDLQQNEEVAEYVKETVDDYNNSEYNGTIFSKQPEEIFRYPKKASEKRKVSVMEDDTEKQTAETYTMKNLVEKSIKDECSLYGELIARKLKKFDETSRTVVMNEIDNLIFRAKMNLSHQQSQPSPQPFPAFSLQLSFGHPSVHSIYNPTQVHIPIAQSSSQQYPFPSPINISVNPSSAQSSYSQNFPEHVPCTQSTSARSTNSPFISSDVFNSQTITGNSRHNNILK